MKIELCMVKWFFLLTNYMRHKCWNVQMERLDEVANNYYVRHICRHPQIASHEYASVSPLQISPDACIIVNQEPLCSEYKLDIQVDLVVKINRMLLNMIRLMPLCVFRFLASMLFVFLMHLPKPGYAIQIISLLLAVFYLWGLSTCCLTCYGLTRYRLGYARLII